MSPQDGDKASTGLISMPPSSQNRLFSFYFLFYFNDVSLCILYGKCSTFINHFLCVQICCIHYYSPVHEAMFLRQIFKKPPGYTCQHLISTLLSLRTGAFFLKKIFKAIAKLYSEMCVTVYKKGVCAIFAN